MKRRHPVTAVFRSVGHAIQFGGVGFFAGSMLSLANLVGVDAVLALFPLGAVTGVGYGLASYYRFEYELTDAHLVIHSGVLARREREIPFRRVQNVDVTRDLLGRVLGLASVGVETAGGGATEATLEFVSRREAERIQAAVRSVDDDHRDTASPDAPTARDDERSLLFELSLSELALFSLGSVRVVWVVLTLSAVPLLGDALARRLVSVARPLGGPPALALAALTPDSALVLLVVALPPTAAAGWVVGTLYSFAGYYDFTLGRSSDDLLYARGLLQRYSGSIPLDKVQRLTVTENVVHRALGYAGLRVETAGYSQTDADDRDVAVPLASRERTLSVARQLEAFGEPSFRGLPARARRRYVVRYSLAVLGLAAVCYAVAVTVGGFEYWYLPLALAPVVPVAAHCKWASRGYAVGDRHVLVRTGFWRRTTHVVPFSRLQTAITGQTIFQRRLGLASVTADTASSSLLFDRSATVHDVDEDEARRLHRLFRAELQNAVGAKETDPPAAPSQARGRHLGGV